MSRTKVLSAERHADHWEILLEENGAELRVGAKMLVNAGGPWVGDVIRNTIRLNSQEGVRLVRGSHIVTKKLFDHDKCYFFQGTDGRIIFAIPYEQDFTLIGTTDKDHGDASEKPVCTDEERDYLLAFASNYFKTPVTKDDVVWTYSGVRPLYDDGATSATAATRDYVLSVDKSGGAPVLNVFGGKITTYRRLAESALEKIEAHLRTDKGIWTAGVPLPGGDFPVDGFDSLVQTLEREFSFLTHKWARRLVRAYGAEARHILADSKTAEDLGENFGATITAAELNWVIEKEWVRTADDYLWRRTKLGLKTSPADAERIDAYIADRLQASVKA